MGKDNSDMNAIDAAGSYSEPGVVFSRLNILVMINMELPFPRVLLLLNLSMALT